ncbi:Uncharacterised protein [Candidatus Bilamarchaeum dharawalense]|uniref:Uncharacterized protein n=1 Tax=Candidatus Bilamarchaeum dharawalense TaxID=2885759 RepID=A0A5E4LVN7_9ARCH|nr:Uncharacterised protein [Candidatus Bilamarchaeum dharawalense]
MRWILLFLPLLFFGCTSNTTGEQLPSAPAPIIQAPPVWIKYSNDIFSFDYPADMVAKSETGLFSGVRYLPSPYGYQPAETLTIVYTNTSEKYGPNQNSIYLDNPTKTTTDFLLDDRKNDSMTILLRGYELGNVTEFTIAERFYVAQLSFKLSDFNTVYHGYALSIFIPENSMHLNVRLVALDPNIAYNMKEAILRSLRLV